MVEKPLDERSKIIFQLNPEDGQGYETEAVWAERVGPNEFRILNSPFFVFGVSYDDIVKTRLENNANNFDSVVRKGGHSTYRIFLQSGHTLQDESFQKHWAPIKGLGATFEKANERLLSVDLAPNVDVQKVYSLLKQGETDGLWFFEEGNYEVSS